MNMKNTTQRTAFVETVSAILFAGIISFLFLLKSPLHPWISSTADTDSSVFKTIAMVMQNGGIPYRDSFDHKGPLLYVINYIGNLISSYKGVWVIEFISLTITLLMLYKIARLACKKSNSVVVVFTAVSLLFIYFEGGNLAEEYAMSFIAISLYLFLKFFLKNKISNIGIFASGFCFGAVLLIRPNMISIWIAMYIAVLFSFLRRKEWKGLLNFIIWSILGLIAIIIPFIIWLGMNNALEKCWEDYILFNMTYTSAEGGRALFPAKWSACFTFSDTAIFILSFFSLLFCRSDEEKSINFYYVLYLLLSLFLIGMSGMTYKHYGMILIPATVYPIARLFSHIENIGLPKLDGVLSMIVSLYLLCTFIAPDWIGLTKEIPQIYESKEDRHISSVVDTISNYIKENTDTEDRISVYGNWDIIYVISNRLHATDYSYVTPIGGICPKIYDDYFKQLEEELPPIIVIQKGYFDNRMARFLAENSYQQVWSQNGDQQGSALIFSRER